MCIASAAEFNRSAANVIFTRYFCDMRGADFAKHQFSRVVERLKLTVSRLGLLGLLGCRGVVWVGLVVGCRRLSGGCWGGCREAVGVVVGGLVVGCRWFGCRLSGVVGGLSGAC